MSPQESLVDPNIVALLGNPELFHESLKPLLNGSFVRRDRSTGTIEIPQLVQQLVYRMLSPKELLEWTKKTICIVSHSFPEEPYLDEPFEALRSQLTPHVFRCIEHAQGYNVQDLSDVVLPLVSMFLAAMGRSGEESPLLDYTDLLLSQQSNVYYRCKAAKWRAYM
jgi:hypothetical protein